MFKHVETINNREIYSALYCEKDFLITYNPQTEEIEQVRPLSVGTDTLIHQFRKYVKNENN